MILGQKSHLILIILNIYLTSYLFISNNKNSALIKTLLNGRHQFMKKKKKFNPKNCENEKNSLSQIDIDMIGLKYPNINFAKYKNEENGDKLISNFKNFLTELEIKLIYLEKEINVTKLNAFYTARTLYLKKKNVYYDDSNINKFHEIISWLVIHKSTQLKGIASDKYLACKYVEYKIGKNLCPHRIGLYNNIEEIDFKNLIKMKNVVLKVSNGCHDNIYITDKTTNNDIDNIKKKLIFHFNREYSFIVPEFFHSYSKKRIVLEKMLLPKEDLYEFKFMVFNNDIKLCLLVYFRQENIKIDYLDKDFNLIKSDRKIASPINNFKKEILDELKFLSIKLSEDFPNFIRVDLYLFHDNIYLSELTFDSNSGLPAYTDIKYFNDGVYKWKRIDY